MEEGFNRRYGESSQHPSFACALSSRSLPSPQVLELKT